MSDYLNGEKLGKEQRSGTGGEVLNADRGKKGTARYDGAL